MDRNELRAKAYSSIVVNDSGSLMEWRDLQKMKAYVPIVNRVDGNLIEDKLMQLSKVDFPISVIPSPTSISVTARLSYVLSPISTDW